eukprot:scaffold77129_cov18-Prasinocladus_malaysianus.AAC.1
MTKSSSKAAGGDYTLSGCHQNGQLHAADMLASPASTSARANTTRPSSQLSIYASSALRNRSYVIDQHHHDEVNFAIHNQSIRDCVLHQQASKSAWPSVAIHY